MKLPGLSTILHRKSIEPFIVLDIGTHAAKAGIFKPVKDTLQHEDDMHIEQEDVPKQQYEILGAGIQPHGQTSFHGTTPYQLDAVLETCSLAIEKASLEAGISPSSAIILASGIITCITTKIKLNRAEPETELTDHELDHIFEKIERTTSTPSRQKALKVLTPHLIEAVNIEPSLTSILTRVRSTTTSFHLDNQRVSSPVGFSGRELKIALSEYFCRTSQYSTITRIAHNLSLDMALLQSPAAAATYIASHHTSNGIVIDIGGNVTEIALYTENEVTDTAFVHWGGNHLTWNIMRVLDTDFHNAEKAKMTHTQSPFSKSTQEHINQITKEWLSILMCAIETSLLYLKKADPLPEDFFLSGGGAYTAYLKSAFVAYPWTKQLNFRAFPKPHLLNPAKNMPSLLGKISQVQGPLYAPMIGSVFASEYTDT